MSKKDARDMLHEEVNESVLRLNKAKFGHKLAEIVPEHKNKFYLPDKSEYMPKQKKLNRNSNSLFGQPSRSNFKIGKLNEKSSPTISKDNKRFLNNS